MLPRTSLRSSGIIFKGKRNPVRFISDYHRRVVGVNVTNTRTCSRRTYGKFAFPEGMKLYEEDYVDTPDYPPIDPETRYLSETQRRKKRKKEDWENGFKEKKTVEEKLVWLNMPRRYGWKFNVLNEDNFAYNCSPYYKWITRTHFVPGYELPETYNEPELVEKARHFAEELKQPLQEALQFELNDICRGVDENPELLNQEIDLHKTYSVLNQVNRLLMASLANETPHLRTCQVDYKPKLDAFWTCGGMEPHAHEIKWKKFGNKRAWPQHKKDPNEPVDRNFQYYGSSFLQIRCVNPIKNFLPVDSELCSKGDTFPDRMRHRAFEDYDIKDDIKFATVLNGHWSGDNHRSSLLSIHPQHHLSLDYKQNDYWREDQLSAIDSQAFLCCFARTIAQAYNFGFEQYSDLDYPFSMQHISTNGLDWSFYAYQANTIKLTQKYLNKNKKQNVCWGTKPMKILENGELNSSVVENLIKFYLNPPTPVTSPKEDATPYLPAKLSDYTYDEREFWFVNFRDAYTQKRLDPSKFPLPEIFDWEMIYKVKFNQLPHDARHRFFEWPLGFPGRHPYTDPYILRDPKKIPCGLVFYRRQLEKRREAEAMEADREAEKNKYFKPPSDDSSETK